MKMKPIQPDNSLIDKAKAVKLASPKGNIGEADVALALAWCRGEVTVTQCTKAWDLNTTGTTYVRLAMALRRYIIETDQ